MSDDTLFEGSGDANEATSEADAAQGATATAPTPQSGGIDPAALSAAIDKALSPVFGKLGDSMQSMSERQGRIEERLTPKADATGTDFYTNPEEAVARVVAQQVSERVGPLMQTILRDKFDGMVGKISSEVDTRWGEGAYQEEFATEMNSIIQDLPPNLRASESHVRMALDSLKGAKFDRLVAREKEMDAKREKESNSGPGYSSLGAGRPAPKGPRLSPDQKQFVATIQKYNPGFTEKQYLASLERGKSLDDWDTKAAN